MKQYFASEGQKGLTMDKAQRICTWADKAMMEAKSKINSINFVSEAKQLIGIAAPLETVIGDTQYDFTEEIRLMIDCTSLMSWLHEAIKAKESLTKELRALTVRSWCASKGVELPAMPDNSQLSPQLANEPKSLPNIVCNFCPPQIFSKY